MASTKKRGLPLRLTFFCELESEQVETLFSDQQLIEQLRALRADISLGIVDFSDQRAATVKKLNQNGIPVIAWQLLPKDQGYWYNMTNAQEAVTNYQHFLDWTARHQLQWAGLGVDIEPDINEWQNIVTHKLRIVPAILKRIFRKRCFEEAVKTYHHLISRMQMDGYSVDSYEFMFMDDDRKAGSCLLGRILGVTDVPATRRVMMLYSSFFRPVGAAVLCNYACGADSVAVGSTGGGIELENTKPHIPLDWDEFSRDLRLARQACDDIHIFSLEGCVEQNFLPKLVKLDWNQAAEQPKKLTQLLTGARLISRFFLWLTAHPFLTGGVLGILLTKLLL